MMDKKVSRKNWGRRLSLLLIVLIIQSCNLPQNVQVEESEEIPMSTAKLLLSDTSDTEEKNLRISPTTIPAPQLGDKIDWVDTNVLVYVPAGEFIMGGDEGHNLEHSVYLDGFWIYSTEVTYRMYLRCMEMGFCTPPASHPSIPEIGLPQNDDLPVVGVTWDQAVAYCQSVGGVLPSEAQWEKAARGPDGQVYPWGDDEPACDLLNFNNCLGETSDVLDYLTGVSPYEVFDMAGNVFEWTADWYFETYDDVSPDENPLGPDQGTFRVVRGSTYESLPEDAASAIRSYFDPETFRSDLGFRCVVAGPEYYAPVCNMRPENLITIVENPEDAPGGSASCIVQQPDISVVTYCQNTTRGNNVSWTPSDAEVIYTSSGGVSCTMYDVDTLACVGNTGDLLDIEVCTSCPPPQVELGILGNCDPPYVLDEAAALCRYDGPPVPDRVNCAPGYSLHGDDSCCEIVSNTPSDFLVCPTGGRFDSASQICWFTLPSSGDEKCATQSVYFMRCQADRHDGGGGDPCNQYDNVNECGMFKETCHWEYDRNECVSN